MTNFQRHLRLVPGLRRSFAAVIALFAACLYLGCSGSGPADSLSSRLGRICVDCFPDAGDDGVPADASSTPDASDGGNDAGSACMLPSGAVDCSNPRCGAQPFDRTVPTSIYVADRALFEGPTSGPCAGVPSQTGVTATIDPSRISVLHGRVLDSALAPVRGVTVTVVAHPEYGQTLTAADGTYSLAMHGGALAAVRYAVPGYLPVQRHLQTQWQAHGYLPDVTLTPVSTTTPAPVVTLGGSATSVAGTSVTDSRGTRTPFVFVPAGTTASLLMPDGSSTPLSSFHLRISEYTVGPNGPTSMPADLPPTSAYTYCADFGVDEEAKAGAKSVVFSAPVSVYLEDFLKFGVGQGVPSGAYDPDSDAWTAVPNGVVLQILGVSGGQAQLDTNGDGKVDPPATLQALGIGVDELTALGARYAAGALLWRMPVPHFSTFDFNFGLGFPLDAAFPTPTASPPAPDCASSRAGSIIHCESRSLGEVIALPGSGQALVYDSARTSGRTLDNTIQIQVTGPTLPKSTIDVRLQVEVAGQKANYDYAPAPNITQTFSWDGRDNNGVLLQGAQPVKVTVSFGFLPIYGGSTAFASYSNSPAFAATGGGRGGGSIVLLAPVYLSASWTGSIGAWDARPLGFGGWSLAEQHVYDARFGTLYLGSGGKRSVQSLGNILSNVVGTGSPGYAGDGGPASQAQITGPHGLVVAPDGTTYFSDELNHRIRKVTGTGIVTTIAGTGAPTFGGDGGPATAAMLKNPMGLALGADGSIYVADSNNARIRRIAPDGTISTFAGNGKAALAGDDGPATKASLSFPHSLTMDGNGTLFVGDSVDHTVRAISTDGIIRRVAGIGSAGFSGDGGPAVNARLNQPLGIAAAPDGNLYLAEWGNNVIRRVAPDGTISTYAGSGLKFGFAGDGGPAKDALFHAPHTLDRAPDGSLYVTDEGNGRVRRITSAGIVETVAGGGKLDPSQDGPPLTASFYVPRIVYVHQDGSVWVADYTGNRIRRFRPTAAISTSASYFFPSADGKEVYAFDEEGRHLNTIDAETGVTLRTFTYGPDHLLSTLTDAYGNQTTFGHDPTGCLSSVTGPFGATTNVKCDANGYLQTVTDPGGAVSQLVHTATGLLTQETSPLGNVKTFVHDGLGRLVSDSEPWGGSTTLSSTGTPDGMGRRVTSTTAEGRTTLFDVEPLPNGGEQRTLTLPSGVTATYSTTGGQTHVVMPDGSTLDVTAGADQRFGMMAPLAKTQILKLPVSGKTMTVTQSRAVTLKNPNDPIHPQTITEFTAINGAGWTRTVDMGAATVTMQSPFGRRVVSHLDSYGVVSSVDVPSLTTIAFLNDSNGRPSTSTWGSRGTSTHYGPNGLADVFKDALTQPWGFGYDPDDRLDEAVPPSGYAVRTGFDTDGDVHTVTLPSGAVHTFNFQNGLPLSYVPPALATGTSSTIYKYSPDVNLQTLTRADGQVMTGTWDPTTGRVGAWNGAGVGIAYGYDTTTGQLKTATTTSESLTFGYDGPVLTSQTWAGDVAGTVSIGLDDNLRVGTETVAGSTVSFGYDSDGMPNAAGAAAIAFSLYDGALYTIHVGQVLEMYGYSPYGEEQTFKVTLGGAKPATLYSVTFPIADGRDVLGRQTKRVETIGDVTTTTTYQYDSGQHLKSASVNGATPTIYTYDPNGNRYTAGGGESYDAQDRLTSKGGVTYGYTLQGDLSSKTNGTQVTTYSYDGTGALRSVVLPSGERIDYVIDGLGRRVGKKINGTLAKGWLYRGRAIVAELDGSGALVSRFVYGSSAITPDYIVKGGTTYAIVRDERGSVRLVADAQTGIVAERIDYDEWGVVTADSAQGFQPFGYAGGLYDFETGLVRFGARDYDASVGRWTNKDPIKFGGGGNLYAYAWNDPVNRTDTSGRNPLLVGAALGAFAGGILDAGYQMRTKGCIDWGEVGIAAVVGGVMGVAAMAELGEMSAYLQGSITDNAAAARAFEEEGLEYLRTVQSDVQPQVSVRPYLDNGELADFHVRLDALGTDEAGSVRLTDFKSSEAAGLTENQELGYPLLERNGGMVVGSNGGPAYPPGFQIPPSPVDILRPGSF